MACSTGVFSFLNFLADSQLSFSFFFFFFFSAGVLCLSSPARLLPFVPMPLGIPTVGPAPADEPDSETRVSHAAQQRLSSSSISWVTHRYSCRSVHSLYLDQMPLMAAHFRMYLSAVVAAHTNAP